MKLLLQITSILLGLLWLLALPSVAHEHRAVGVLPVSPSNEAVGGEPLRIIGDKDGTKVVHYLRPRAILANPRPEGYHPEQRGGGFYYLDERPRTIYDTQGNPVLDPLGQALVATDGFSLIALSSDSDFPEVNHAHPGALISCEIISVVGPPNAHFGFWDSQRSFYEATPTYSLLTNQPTGSPRFIISEGLDAAGADTYGHIHDRSWTADKPGDYYVTIRFIDISTNRPGGGPWHSPSPNYVYHFKAGPDFQPSGKIVSGSGFVMTWPSEMGISDTAYPPETGIVFQILRSTTLAEDDWHTIGTVTGTATGMVIFTDPSPPTSKAFYKLNYDWSTP